MSITLCLMVFSGLFFIIFLCTLLPDVVRGKRRRAIYGAMALAISLGLIACTAYITTYRPYKRIGEEIYASLFGIPKYNCINIQHSQDKVVPIRDYAVWMQFDCCAAEMGRILSRHPYTLRITTRQQIKEELNHAGADWFRPELLGDTVLIYRYNKGLPGNVQIIYTNTNETEVYCIDM